MSVILSLVKEFDPNLFRYRSSRAYNKTPSDGCVFNQVNRKKAEQPRKRSSKLNHLSQGKYRKTNLASRSVAFYTTTRTRLLPFNLVTWLCGVNLWKCWLRIRKGGAKSKWKSGPLPHSSDLGACPAWVRIMSSRRKNEKMNSNTYTNSQRALPI